MKRGEIRWYTFRLPDKRRPVLILTRNEVIGRLNEIMVVLEPTRDHECPLYFKPTRFGQSAKDTANAIALRQ